MRILNISESLEKIVLENELLDLANPLKNEFAISKSEDLRKAIFDMEDENRVLKVGIVGRVKAGKSSLLNALIFDGKNILPKAATPMTAALTKLEYGEKTEASVDFYTQEDINDLKIDFDRYNQKFINIKQQQIEELSKIKLNKLNIKELDEESKNEVEQKAENITNREMKKDDKLFASYDQYTRIKQSMINLVDLENFKNIEAENIESLNNKLYDFVGADGKYMPFTKSVTIRLNDENLRNIEIIDTPGINDPITSREERTKQLLKYCDVILIVSPSGQFLSNEDIELLDRISTKEGIQEIYIIASQIDNQLYGSEKEQNKANLTDVLKSLSSNLTKHLKDTILKQKSLYPYQSELFDKLMKNDVLYSSGATFSLLKGFDNKDSWDDNLHHVWNNLNQNYKDYFSDDESAKANLKNLANIDKVNEIFSEIRIRKDEILKLKKENFEKIKLDSIFKYKESLENDIKSNINLIQSSDIEEIKQQKHNLLKVKVESSEALNWVYEDYIEEFKRDLQNSLYRIVDNYFKDGQSSINNAESSETITWTTGWFFKDHHSKEITVVKTSIIRDSLEKITSNIKFSISKEIDEKNSYMKKNLYSQIIPVLREKIGDENINLHQIQKVVRSVLNLIESPKLDYTDSFPKELKRTETLKRYEAENFITDAKNYIYSFEKRVLKDIDNYLSFFVEKLKQQKLGEDIFSSYSKNIENLENDINNKELSLERNQYILKQLENIND